MPDDLTVDDLAAAEYNPRIISDSEAAGLRGSIEEFGDISGIVWNRRTRSLVTGHQRLNALKSEAAAKGVDLEIADGVIVAPSGTFPIRVVDWPLKKEKRANLAANNPHIQGDWSETAAALVESVKEDDDPVNLDALFDSLNKTRNLSDLSDPPTPDPPADPVTQPGDVWTLGRHRLVCGDSTNRANVEKARHDKQSLSCLTDPPYGIGYEYNIHKDFNAQANDALIEAVFCHLDMPLIYSPGKMNLARELAKRPTAKIICWHKGFASAGSGLGGASTWEPFLVIGVCSGSLPDDYIHFRTDREPGLREKHPCPKPAKLIAHLIEHLTRGDIFDPFLGAGTTIIAAEQLGRCCCGLEIDPAYCDVIVERWETLTGEKAVRRPV